MDSIPIFVCKNAVIKPEHTPAPIAANNASTGCPEKCHHGTHRTAKRKTPIGGEIRYV